jgi:hypothetical protein
MARKLMTFVDIIDAIAEAIGVQSTDTNARNKIKRLINMYYINEIIPFKRWQWLEKNISVIHKAYYNTGTAAVTPSSTTVTLSIAPSSTLGSFKGYRFSVDGSNKVYTVSAHTAESTTVTLTSAYQEALDATAEYRVWRDRIDLPTEAKETVEIWHSEQPKPLDAVGSQGFRKLEAGDPKSEGFPTHYNTWDFHDPSSGDDEFETDRYRQTRIYPSITATPVTLNVDYIQEVEELDDDADEPLMPISDRIVLYYGAGADAWSVINRNEEMADKWRNQAMQKLARMAGDREDGMDTPSLSPKSGYLNAIRRGGLRRNLIGQVSFGGQSSVSMPTYLEDVTINGATITGNVDVSASVTIDGRDISADGAVLDSLVAGTDATLTDNVTAQPAVVWAVATYDVIHINYSISRGAGNREAGTLTILSDGTSADIVQGGVVNLGTVGVTFGADVAGGNVRLLYTTTSTGTNATFTYREAKWLA